MSRNLWTPMITSNSSLRNKNLRAHNKVAHVEFLRGNARPVPRYVVTVTYKNQHRRTQKKYFLSSKNRAKLKTKNITSTFGKTLFLTKYWMRYAIYMPPNKQNDGCLWKPAKRNSVRASKQLRFVAITETLNGNKA